MALVIGTLFATGANAETRSLKLYFLHTKEKAEITYKVNGKYIDSGLKKINRFLRDWRRDEPTKMDPHLLDLIWEVYQKSGSRDYIHVVSAYRSPATNGMLRSRSKGVAKNSQHMLGKAMDFFLPDVKLAKLREIGLKMGVGGVGYYPTSGSPFVHMDTGRVRHWPRMTRQQLVQIFPNGNTLHLPTDGKPLPGYEKAMASYKARRSGQKDIVIASAEEPKKLSFFERLALARKTKEEQKNPAKETVIASAGESPASDDDDDPGESVDALPFPESAPRSPLVDDGDNLQLAAAQSGGLDTFPTIIPVPQKRPSHNPADQLMAETRKLLESSRPAAETAAMAALTPGEIENLRRTAVSKQAPAAVLASFDLARLQAEDLPATDNSAIAANLRQINSASRTMTPRPAQPVPAVALLDEPEGLPSTLFSSSAEAATRLANQTPRQSIPALKAPIPLQDVPGGNRNLPNTADGVERGHTGAIARTEDPVLQNDDSRYDGPSSETLKLALAATEPDNSASKAIRELVAKRNETASRKAEPNDQIIAAALAGVDGSVPIRSSAFPVPEPRPNPDAQVETGRVIVNDQQPEKPVTQSVAVAMNNSAQQGNIGQWALASGTPIGLISRLSPPAYGKFAYAQTEPKYLMAGFAKTGQQYQTGRLSTQYLAKLFSDQ